MTLIDKIKKSIEGSTGFPFLYHAAGEINELLARCDSLPVAYSFLIDSGTIDDVNGRYHERVTIAVIFCDKTEFDFNAIENEEIIDRMKVKAYKWLQSLRMSNTLRIVSINNTQRLYDNTTDVLTGFAVNITIDDIAGVGECELPQVVIDVDKNGSYDVVGVDKIRVNVVPNFLEELEVTQNGEYKPQEGVDGFSKVVANVFPTRKVMLPNNVRVTNMQIIDGYWAGELVDTSTMTVMDDMFSNCSQLQNIDVSNWDTSNVTGMNRTFYGCSQLQNIDVSNWDVSKVKTMYAIFSGCVIKSVDLSKWDVSNLNNINYFGAADALTYIGGRTIDEVLTNNIKCLNGLRRSFYIYSKSLDRASLRAIINGLADLTGETTQTLNLGATLMARLTEEDIAIATNKNWTIV